MTWFRAGLLAQARLIQRYELLTNCHKQELGEGKSWTSTNRLGMQTLYEIAQLPPAERQAEHVTAKGETKTPSEMTVKELRELKRQPNKWLRMYL